MNRNVCAVIFTITLCGHALLLASNDVAELPEEVVSALNELPKGVKTLTIAWSRSRTSPLSRDLLATELGVKDYAYFEQPSHEHFILQGVKVYSYARFPAVDKNGGLVSQHAENSYNGSYLYGGSGVDYTVGLGANPVLSVQRIADMSAASASWRLWDGSYFKNAGVWVPETGGELDESRSSTILRALSQGQRVSKIETLPFEEVLCWCVELRSGDGVSRYWLSKEHAMALVYAEKRNGKNELLNSVKNSEFQKLKGTSIYLPRRSIQNWYSWESAPQKKVYDTPIVIDEFKVTELDTAAVDESVFALVYKHPGSLIWDAALADRAGVPGQVRYVVPADTKKLDQVIKEAAIDLGGDLPRQSSWFSLRNLAYVIVNAIGLGLLVYFLIVKRA